MKLAKPAVAAIMLAAIFDAPALAGSKDCGHLRSKRTDSALKVPVGQTRSTTFTLENIEPHFSADIATVEVMPTPPFGVGDGCKGELQPDSECTVTVSCTPQLEGKFKGELTFTSTIKRCAKKVFKLECEGSAPVPTATATASATATPTTTATATATHTATPTATPTATATPGPALFLTTGASLDTGDSGTVAAYLLPLSSNPNTPPSGTFTGGSFLNSAGIAVDASGNIYVAQTNAASIDRYPPGSSGLTSPSSSISGMSDTLVFPQLIALDSTPNIYVANYGAATCMGAIAVFPGGGNGNIAPSKNIACMDMSHDNTLLDQPQGVALDSTKNIYVTNRDFPSITIYPAGSTGNAAPTAIIAGGNGPCGFVANPPACCTDMSCVDMTQLGKPIGIALDSKNNIYVTNSGGPPGAAGYSVTIYSAIGSSTGFLNLVPVATIAGSNTQLNFPSGIVLDSRSNIYVANLEGGQTNNVTVYSPLGTSTGALNEAPIAAINSAQFVPGSPFGLAIGQFTPPP